MDWPCFPSQMAVLEIQTNGDTRVSEEAIARARHSLDDPNMREFILSCLTLNPDKRPTANNLLFHRVLFEVHSLKLLAAHCFINHQYLMPENVVEEKIKELDLNMVMAEIRREGRPGAQWRYSEVSFLELDKFLEDVRNGIYPLMNFAVSRPHALPRALSQPQEDPQKAKTPTPEPFDVETRKVRPAPGGDSSCSLHPCCRDTSPVGPGESWERNHGLSGGIPKPRGAVSRLMPSWAFPGGADAVQHGAERGQEPVAREYLDPDPLPALGETCSLHIHWEMGLGNHTRKSDRKMAKGNLPGVSQQEMIPGSQTGKGLSPFPWYPKNSLLSCTEFSHCPVLYSERIPKKSQTPLACGTHIWSLWMSLVFPDTLGLLFFLAQNLQGPGIAPGHQHCPKAPPSLHCPRAPLSQQSPRAPLSQHCPRAPPSLPCPRAPPSLPSTCRCLWRGWDEQTLSCLHSSRSCSSWRTNCTASSAMTCCPVCSHRECWVWMLGNPVALLG
uniref:Nuclear receptor binding protein 2 n=1 Tax=Cyanistes caeruleus TaxID=156563 RepID=A0A8C0V1J9_CYACU